MGILSNQTIGLKQLVQCDPGQKTLRSVLSLKTQTLIKLPTQAPVIKTKKTQINTGRDIKTPKCLML
jgi:hypothetical protein